MSVSRASLEVVMSERRGLSIHPWSFQVAPSGVTVQRDSAASAFMDLADVRQLLMDGMAQDGWADWFREEMRDLFSGVAACEECGSVRDVECHGWEREMLCGVHRAARLELDRQVGGL